MAILKKAKRMGFISAHHLPEADGTTIEITSHGAWHLPQRLAGEESSMSAEGGRPAPFQVPGFCDIIAFGVVRAVADCEARNNLHLPLN